MSKRECLQKFDQHHIEHVRLNFLEERSEKDLLVLGLRIMLILPHDNHQRPEEEMNTFSVLICWRGSVPGCFLPSEQHW